MRRAGGPTVSLFPFLTVLLCASGTLIVLLIALSQHVRDGAAADAPEPAAGAEPPTVRRDPETPAPRPVRVVSRPNREPDRRPTWRVQLAAAEAGRGPAGNRRGAGCDDGRTCGAGGRGGPRGA